MMNYKSILNKETIKKILKAFPIKKLLLQNMDTDQQKQKQKQQQHHETEPSVHMCAHTMEYNLSFFLINLKVIIVKVMTLKSTEITESTEVENLQWKAYFSRRTNSSKRDRLLGRIFFRNQYVIIWNNLPATNEQRK